jgi:hypothetical protein
MLWIQRIVVLTLCATIAGGCGWTKFTSGFEPAANYVKEPEKHGKDYCREVTKDSRILAENSTRLAYMLAIVGIVAIAAGGIMGPDSDGDNWLERNRNLVTAQMGSLSAGISLYFFSRADAATKLSAKSGAVLTKSTEPAEAFAECVDARSQWLGSKIESNSLVTAKLSAAEKRVEELAKKAADIDKKVEESTRQAAAARKAAAEAQEALEMIRLGDEERRRGDTGLAD